MTLDLSSSISLHAAALKVHERRGAILASNIANAATPGYKARDIDFPEQVRIATGADVNGTRLTMTSRGHQASANGVLSEPGFRLAQNAALDGNTVELAVEQVAFAETMLRQQASLTLLNRRISGLMTAIKGE